MTDEQLTEVLAEVHAAWLMDPNDEGCQTNAMRAVAEAAASAERERIACHFDERDKGVGGFYDPHEPAEIIRALTPNV